jgi:hypothetical protein
MDAGLQPLGGRRPEPPRGHPLRARSAPAPRSTSSTKPTCSRGRRSTRSSRRSRSRRPT